MVVSAYAYREAKMISCNAIHCSIDVGKLEVVCYNTMKFLHGIKDIGLNSSHMKGGILASNGVMPCYEVSAS